MTAACVGVQLISKTQGETGGFAGVLRRFWVVPNPEIGFSLRPLSIHKSETNLRNRFFSNNFVWIWVKNRDFGKDEPTAFNAFLTMPGTQLNGVTLGTNGQSRAF